MIINNYKNFNNLPQDIQNKYNSEINRYTPMERFEYIVMVGKMVGASDIHITPSDYDVENKDNLVKIKFRIDGDLDNYIYNLGESFKNDPRSYIKMNEYKEFTYAVKDSLGLKANDNFTPGDARNTFEHKDQTGKITGKTKLRISVMPTGIEIVDLGGGDKKIFLGYHQSIVSRIIVDEVKNLPSFDELDLLPSIKEKLSNFLKSGNGSLFIAGPTGSGKSVMLQVLLTQIASEKIKIHTLEDPIEYINPLLIQTQIAKEKGFDWLSGLMSLMRQDPDVIMIGEIRTLDVGKMSLEASVTGHQLFSTTHAKSGIGTYDRFRQMGIPGYILSGITVSVGARLVRKLCPHCKEKMSSEEEKLKLSNIFDSFFHGFDFGSLSGKDLCKFINDEEGKFLSSFEKTISEIRVINAKLLNCNIDKDEFILLENRKKELNRSFYDSFKKFFVNNSYKRKEGGCEYCLGKGVKGRVGIHEFVFMNKELEKMILEEKPIKYMEDYIRSISTITLDRNGIIKMMRGLIDYDELVTLNVNND